MSQRSQYVVRETLISAAINTALSIGFVFLAFHGRPRIAVPGVHGIVLDMAPQTFMVVLMSCLVPALLTRSRHAAGALAWHAQPNRSIVPDIWVRAVLLAVLTTCVVTSLSWLVLPRLLPSGVDFRALLLGKALFGMMLALLVTPWAIARVLR